ncbi:hypothetical protein HYU13_01145 [Candidatus Woesearchaeota archaeon]|nr:hypothetical protein [Candidatus Woesearchaeota archaeon]
MTIIGFNFNKITVVRNDGVTGKINIKNNVTVKDVKDQSLDLGSTDQKALKFVFEFTTSYDPNLGSIGLTGDVVYLDTAKEAKGILDEWKKTKKVKKEVMANILNTVLTKCNIEALILSQKVNLPPPVPLPRVTSEPVKESE